MINKNKQDSVKFYTPYFYFNPKIFIEVLTETHNDKIISVLESFPDIIHLELNNKLFNRLSNNIVYKNRRYLYFETEISYLNILDKLTVLVPDLVNNLKPSILFNESYDILRNDCKPFILTYKPYTKENIIGKEFVVYNDKDVFGNINLSILKLLAFLPNTDYPYIVQSSVSNENNNLERTDKIITARYKYGFPAELAKDELIIPMDSDAEYFYKQNINLLASMFIA